MILPAMMNPLHAPFEFKDFIGISKSNSLRARLFW